MGALGIFSYYAPIPIGSGILPSVNTGRCVGVGHFPDFSHATSITEQQAQGRERIGDSYDSLSKYVGSDALTCAAGVYIYWTIRVTGHRR
jgi:hypothetical protein